MKNQYIYLTFFSLILLFAFSVGSVSAESSGDASEERQAKWEEKAAARQEALEEREAEREAKREEFFADRCEHSKEQIQLRLEKATENHEKFVSYFEDLQARLEEHLSRLSEHGCDVSVSEDSLATMQEKVDALQASHNEYVSILEGLDDVACEETGGGNGTAFNDAVDEAKTQLSLVKQNAVNLRNYVRTTLKEELKDQVNECRETLSNAADDDSSDTEEE